MRPSLRFAINAASNWVQMAVAAGVGAIIVPYAIHRLGDVRYGIYGEVSAVLNFLMVFDLGLSAAVTRYSSQDHGRDDGSALRETASTAMVVLTGVGLLGAALLAAAAPLIQRFFEIPAEFTAELVAINLCLAASFALRFAAVTPRGLLIAGNRYDLLNGVETTSNVVRLAALVAWFEWISPTLLGFGLTFVATQAVRLGGFQLLVRTTVLRAAWFRARQITRSALRRLVGFSAVNFIAVLGGLALTQGPVVLIGKLLGAEGTQMVAAYAPTQLIVGLLQMFTAGLCSPIIPLAGGDAAAGGGKRLGDWSLRLSRLTAVASAALVLPIVLLAEPLLRWWVGATLAWTAPVLIVSVAAQFVYGIQSGNYYLILGGGKIGAWSLGQTAFAVVGLIAAAAGQIAFGWGLVGICSAVGAAVVLMSGVFMPAVTCAQFGVSRRRYAWDVLIRPMIPVAIVGAAGALLVRAYPPASLASLVAAGAVSSLAYLAIAWRLALRDEDRALALGLLRRGRSTERAPEA